MAAHLVWRDSKRKGGQIAHIRFWLQGHKYFRSLKTTDETAAKSKLWQANETLRRLEHGDLALPDDCTFTEAFEFIISGGKQLSHPKVVDDLTLERIAHDYFDGIPSGAKEESSLATEKTHVGHLKRLLKSSTRFRAIGVPEIQAYVAARRRDKGLRGKPVQPKTIKKEIQTFKQLWDFARVRGHVDGDCPTQHAKLPKGDEKPPFHTWDQIESAIKQGGVSEEQQAELWDSLFLREADILNLLEHVRRSAEHAFVHPMFAFTAFTGARRSEIIRSQIRDFQFDNGLVLIREKKRRHDVRMSYRRVQLHPHLASIMQQWFAEHPGGACTICIQANLERSRNKNESPEPLSASQANDHFKRAVRGSRWEVVRGFHVLRHSFASICAMKGIHQSIIDQWLGHQTEEMRNRYRHLFPEEVKKAMDSLLTSDIGTLFGR